MSDSESPVIFPKHVAVAFKGANGKYLSAQSIEGHQYLKFASNDIEDATVRNEIFPVGDGTIRIRNNFFGKFWRRDPNWIRADSDDTSCRDNDTLFRRRSSHNWIRADSDDTSCRDKDTLFRPVKVDDSVNRVITLKNLGNQLFGVSLTKEGKEDCLNAHEPTITKKAHLEVHVVV